MAKLKIFTFPDKVLYEIAQPIARVEKPLRKVADDMLETMYDAPGIGLAANQVGILERILVLDTEYDYEEFPEGSVEDSDDEDVPTVIINKKPIIVINPVIVFSEGATAIKEGCLSVPDYQAEVDRFEKIKIEYQDIDGLKKTMSADGLRAVCIQHEIDHLDGKLFIDRLSTMKMEMAKKRLIKARKA